MVCRPTHQREPFYWIFCWIMKKDLLNFPFPKTTLGKFLLFFMAHDQHKMKFLKVKTRYLFKFSWTELFRYGRMISRLIWSVTEAQVPLLNLFPVQLSWRKKNIRFFFKKSLQLTWKVKRLLISCFHFRTFVLFKT